MSSYLETLRRVPDDVILAVATRDIDMVDNRSCVCGWVVREYLAAIQQVAADDVNVWASPVGGVVGSTYRMCKEAFGGTEDEWCEVYAAFGTEQPALEAAFVRRVMEAAGVA